MGHFQVADVRDMLHLAPLRELRVLWLSDNPCSEHPLYRLVAARLLPRLEKLDNKEVSPQEREEALSSPEVRWQQRQEQVV